jgi:hypothetical protein
MKLINRIVLISAAVITLTACDKKFVEINTNPYQVTSTDPGYLFTNALRNTPASDWLAESTIAQQFVLPYNLGTTAGYQFNDNVDGLNSGAFGVYTGTLKNLQHIINGVRTDPNRVNLYNESRIWRAFNFMWLVDHYGDVPYSETGLGYSDGIFRPKYEKASVIYEDIYKELKEATAALNPTGDNVSRFDIFVPANATTSNQVTFWKRLAYSVMLRLGMRYSKVDAAKAKAIVVEAYNGGVMQSNDDNVYIKNQDANLPINGYINSRNNVIRITNPYYYYLAEPFVTRLKTFRDPRLKYISARYTPNQTTAPSVANPDTTMANQFGFPVGYSDATLKNYPGFRPAVGGGQDYSQINFNTVGNSTAPILLITNAQTKLLLAEAASRDWLANLAGAKTARQYYEEGVRASIDAYTLFPNTAPISSTLQDQYLQMPGVAWDNSRALELINTQYWIESFNNGYEAWCNWRRTALPLLQPNLFNNNLNGGFVRRFAYPLREVTANAENYSKALADLGGSDNLTSRVFWDTP